MIAVICVLPALWLFLMLVLFVYLLDDPNLENSPRWTTVLYYILVGIEALTLIVITAILLIS